MSRVQLQPLGYERMMERLQEFRARVQPAGVPFSDATGVSGLSGNLPGAPGSFQPMKVTPDMISNDKASPQLQSLIEQAANANGIDPLLLDSVVACESSYDPRCRSSAGAMGLAQLMPENVRELGITDPFDPAQNLNGGAKLLSRLIARYKKLPIALAAYNAGSGAVDRHGGGIPNYPETQNYVRKVMQLYELRRNGG